jgi:hypothetical protein
MTIRTRLIDLFAPFTLDFDNPIHLDSCIALLRKMRPSKAMQVLKTWTNSWATSHRSHDPTILPCLLGCKAHTDSLIHYLQCPHMYSLMKFFDRSTDENPLIRFGLVNPSLNCLAIICCTSAGYHAVRRHVRRFQPTLTNMELCVGDVRRFWTVFAEAFTAEAGELCLQCTSFSVPKFLSFLIEVDQVPNLT